MNKATVIKQDKQKAYVGVRINASFRDEMLKWADDRNLTLSWVLERCLEIGWPMFLEQNFYGLEMRPRRQAVGRS